MWISDCPRTGVTYIHTCLVLLLWNSAVGASGQVYSFESNPHHMHAARSNYSQWRVNWALTRTSLWPDNVLFLEQSVTDAGKYMTSEVDAVSRINQCTLKPKKNISQKLELADSISCIDPLSLPPFPSILAVQVVTWCGFPKSPCFPLHQSGKATCQLSSGNKEPQLFTNLCSLRSSLQGVGGNLTRVNTCVGRVWGRQVEVYTAYCSPVKKHKL